MPERGQGAAQLQHHQMTHDIRLDIGIGIDQRIAHARLRRQMHDPGDFGKRLGQRQNGAMVGDIELSKDKRLVSLQPRQARLLERDVVIVVEIVYAQHRVNARQQRFGHLRPDKASGACDQDHASRIRRRRRRGRR